MTPSIFGHSSPWPLICRNYIGICYLASRGKQKDMLKPCCFPRLRCAGFLFKSGQHSEVPWASWAFWMQLSSYILCWWKEDAHGPRWLFPVVWWLCGNTRTLKTKYILNFWSFGCQVCKVGKSRKYLSSSLFLLLPLASSLSSPSFDLFLLACLSHLSDIRNILSRDWITTIKDVKDKRWGKMIKVEKLLKYLK